MFSTLQKDPTNNSSLEYNIYKYNTELPKHTNESIKHFFMMTKENEKQLEQKGEHLTREMVKNHFPVAKEENIRHQNKMETIEQVYLGMITVVGLFIIYRVLDRDN